MSFNVIQCQSCDTICDTDNQRYHTLSTKRGIQGAESSGLTFLNRDTATKTLFNMKKAHVSVVFDRKKRVQTKGTGLVEVIVYFNRDKRKFIPVAWIEPQLWPAYEQSSAVREVVLRCEQILSAIEVLNKPMNMEAFNELYDKDSLNNVQSAMSSTFVSDKNSFLDFFFDELGHEKIAPRTRQARMVVYNTLLRFDRIHTFDDLTPAHILELHKFIQGEAPRRPQNLSDGDDIESLQCRKSSMM